MTVDELKTWLSTEESKWTEDDCKYLGEFKNQVIYSPHWEKVPETFNYIFKGWDHNNHIYWDVTGLGIFIDTKEV